MKNKTSITRLTRLCLCALLCAVFVNSYSQSGSISTNFSNFQWGWHKTKTTDTIQVVILTTDCDTCVCKATKALAVRFQYSYSGDPMPPGDYSPYWSIEKYITRKMEMLAYVINKVKDKYCPNGVILDDIAYKSDIRLPEKLKTAINDKIEATQLALKAEAQIQQSTAEANKMIATARGEYVRDSLKAEANILLSKSLTPLLVTMKAYERWNGEPSMYSGNGSPLPLILQSK